MIVDKGLRVSPENGQPDWPFKSALSVFFECFGILGDRLSQLYWCDWNFISGPYDIFAEDEFGEDRLANLFVAEIQQYRDKTGYPVALLRPGSLPGLGPYIFSDDSEWIGLRVDEGGAVSFVNTLIDIEKSSDRLGAADPQQRISLSNARRDVLRENAEHYFRCHDGAYWDFFSEDEIAIPLVFETLSQLGGLALSFVELEDPDWEL